MDTEFRPGQDLAGPYRVGQKLHRAAGSRRFYSSCSSYKSASPMMNGEPNREGTMCVLRLCRLMVLGMVLWAATAEATTYYVGTTGNDSNNGTSLNTPFRTIGKAASVVNPGDVVNVRGGTYGEAVNIN